MKDLMEGLNTRLDLIIRTKSDRDFYMAIYQYYDYIHKTPELKAILDQSEREYSMSFSEIWKERRSYTEEELDIRSAQVNKLERFNMYSVGCTAIMRIYWPIHFYKTTPEPDLEQDPLSLILVRGFKYTLGLKKWSKDYLKSFNWWFEGNRNYYETETGLFNVMLLDEIAKIKEPIKVKPKTDFQLNPETGEFVYRNIEGTLSPESREFKFIKTLYTSPAHQTTYKELLGKTEEISDFDRITLTETLKIVKRKLGILPIKKGSNPNIIKNIAKYGYKLDI